MTSYTILKRLLLVSDASSMAQLHCQQPFPRPLYWCGGNYWCWEDAIVMWSSDKYATPKGHLLIVGEPFKCRSVSLHIRDLPDSKIHGANMGPTWVLSAPAGPHFGLMNMNLTIRVELCHHCACRRPWLSMVPDHFFTTWHNSKWLPKHFKTSGTSSFNFKQSFCTISFIFIMIMSEVTVYSTFRSQVAYDDKRNPSKSALLTFVLR